MTQTRINIQADAKVFPLTADFPIIGGKTVSLTNGSIRMSLPTDLFPYLQQGDVVYISLSACVIRIEEEPEGMPLILGAPN